MPSADHQRLHYKTDHHRYNLKRKVAGLPLVTAHEFNQRINAVQQHSERQQKEAMLIAQRGGFVCDVCKKVYSTQNAFDQHMTSKRHLEAVASQSASASATPAATSTAPADSVRAEKLEKLKQDSLRSHEIHRQLVEARTEEEVVALLKQKDEGALRLDIHADCLFCVDHHSHSLDENLEHMATKHSFYIPDLECVTDMEGLVGYLADKVSVSNMCLYCNTAGKAFHSVEGVRKHMLTKGHTKIDFENDALYSELAEYYDFGDNEDDDEEWEDEEVTERDLVMVNGGGSGDVGLDETGTSWALPSGQVIGHRSMLRYYKQNLRSINGSGPRGRYNSDEPNGGDERALVRHRVAEHYERLGLMRGRVAAGMNVEAMTQRRLDNARQIRETRQKVNVGVKSNKLQRYYRPQVDF